ncbi:ammonium transporter [Lentisphaera profundi]|uniref:Ammonium transporter n=1 Tax=Lentisphaera profundi TaxID=1658616 RepID=A0ABY7VWW6_9BACT|nr:ammonium transporter [Lentisphaera profundi]WDE97224.1 ammonium transporter [Lentisphaera profundi]
MKKLMFALVSLFATGIFSLSASTELAPAAEGLSLESFKKDVKANYDSQSEKAEVSASIEGSKTVVDDGISETYTGVITYTISTEGEASLSFASDDKFWTSNVFMMFCAVLVFIMHLGFCCLEVGFCRAKNSVNIIFKNFTIVAIATLVYAAVGFNIMYPGDFSIGTFFGFAGFGIGGTAGEMGMTYSDGYSYWTDFLFQAMFAAATASIVSGAVCERIKINSFLIFCTIFAGVIYPIIGSWGWGGGFLGDFGFHDLAGSGLVHATGGAGALAGAIVLGPRIGKYVNGKTFAIMGHNMPVAAIGAFLLWFGWFGFNGGSQLNADPMGTSGIMVMTLLASTAGVVTAMAFSWTLSGKPDLSMVLNGALAGLVGITAGADVVSPTNAIIIGAIAGVLVVLAVLVLDKLKIDDPVGAIPVHLVCGSWGVVATGIFGTAEGCTVVGQIKSILCIVAFAFICAFILFSIIKVTIGLRVSEEEELEGLDLGEHGMEAYSGFQIFTNQ